MRHLFKGNTENFSGNKGDLRILLYYNDKRDLHKIASIHIPNSNVNANILADGGLSWSISCIQNSK